MRRTQLYLDEEMAKILETLSRQKGTTISELVRASLREHYLPGKDIDKVLLARNLAGIWRDREDLKGTDAVIRKLRKSSRRRRNHIA